MKKKLISILQLAIGAGLISFLFYRMDNKADLLAALRAIAKNWPYLIGAILCFLVCITACAQRWRMLLNAHDMHLSFPKAIKLYFIGQFFNAFMLGSVGGDLVKVFFVAKIFPHKRTEAVSTVFIDRIMGLLALIGLATCIVAIRHRFFMRYPETRSIMAFMIVVALATLASLFVIFRRNIFEHWAFFKRIEERTALGKTISRTYKAFHGCFTQRGVLVSTLLLSLVNHLTLILAALLIGLGLNIHTVHPTASSTQQTNQKQRIQPPALLYEFGNYLTVFPIINGIAAIPATPGGLGTREYATKFLLGVPEFGVPATRAIPLSLLLYATTLFWSLVGGVIYAAHAIRQERPTQADLANLT